MQMQICIGPLSTAMLLCKKLASDVISKELPSSCDINTKLQKPQRPNSAAGGNAAAENMVK